MGAVSQGKVDTAQRVAALRDLMDKHGLEAYVVPSEDAHASEYPAESDLRRGYISGFSGSAGCAVVGKKEAALFTDGRYFLQAGQQLQPDVWKLMKQGEANVPTWQEYLSKNVGPKSKIGMDPTLISAEDARSISADLESVGSELVGVEENLVDQVWGSQRPKRPSETIFVLDEAIAGRSAADKIQDVRNEIKSKGSHLKGYVANMLDEVAWLFNLRGSDVPYNPVFFAYTIVLLDKVLLYVDASGQMDQKTRDYVTSTGAEIRPYENFYTDLKAIGNEVLGQDDKVLIGKKASLAVQEALGGASKVLIDRSIIVDQKSIKNKVEIQGFRDSHIRDGAALASFFAWLEEQLVSGQKISESRAADELENCRKKQDKFRGPSFTTISSTGSNGSIIHYSPNPADCPDIDPKQLYLW